VSVPRVVVAAPASGHGKTTVATGLMTALRAAGHQVSGHKVGPDYIDPGYHALATGRPGRNLDPHLVGEDLLVPLFLHGAASPTPADVAVVEGVMGLYDGALGRNGFASTAHVAAELDAPVLLVVDISSAARSIGAVVHGMATFDPAVRIAGVILNKAGSPRHAAEAQAAVEGLGLPVLGVLHRDDGITAPSRHLGLVPAAERPDARGSLDRLTSALARHVDVAAVLDVARSAPPLHDEPWNPAAALGEASRPAAADAPVVAVAGGRAFTFRYAETEELLHAAGCRIVVFDPTTDSELPAGTSAIYLGGGFPEMHAAELGANTSMLAAVRDAVLSGVPTVAECAGLLYLCRSVDGTPMTGAIAATGSMTPRLTLGYRTARAHDTLLTRPGERVTGHEFHRTTVIPGSGAPAWTVGDRSAGFASPSLHASYLHTHWAGFPRMAARFAEAARAFSWPVASPPSRGVASCAPDQPQNGTPHREGRPPSRGVASCAPDQRVGP
jgi:cobyrinic acid a,c-diamide synthase